MLPQEISGKPQGEPTCAQCDTVRSRGHMSAFSIDLKVQSLIAANGLSL